MTIFVLLLGLLALVAFSRAQEAGNNVIRLEKRVNELLRQVDALRQLVTLGDARPAAPAAELARPAPWSETAPAPDANPYSPPDASPHASAAIDSSVPAFEEAIHEPPNEELDLAAPVALNDEEQPTTAAAPAEATVADEPTFFPPPPPPPFTPAPPRAAAPRPPSRDAEQDFATRWAVWIGGVALAMGGLLIVRYSIEAGFFGPGVRLAMGALFALALAGGAEFLRRKELKIVVGALPSEDIPSVLAGASVASGFGVVYAAHAVYAMIGAPLAFGLLGAIGVTALVVSLIYGRGLGLLGLVGSYATPFLVGGAEPNAMALSLFVAVVTSVAFGIDIRRRSALLLGSAIAGHAGWTALIALANPGSPWIAFMLLVAAVIAIIDVEFAGRDDTLADFSARTVRFAAFATPLVVAGLLLMQQGDHAAFRFALIVLVAANIVAAVRSPGMAPLAPLAGAAATGFVLLWPTAFGPVGMEPHLLLDMLRLNMETTVGAGFLAGALVFGALVSPPLAFALLRRYRNGDADPFARGCLAFASALAPLGIALAASLRLNGFERTPGFAAIAAVLTLALAALSELLFRSERCERSPQDDPMAYVGSAAYAAGAAIALGLAVAFAMRETWLVVGFAVASAGVALVSRARPIPLLRTIAASFGTATLARLAWRPILTDLGGTPVFNWLILAYGVPAAAFATSALALSRRRDRALMTAEALFAIFICLFVLFEIAQAFVGGDLRGTLDMLTWRLRLDYSTAIQQRATGLYALAGVAMALLAILFARLGDRRQSIVCSAASSVLALALVGVGVLGLGVEANPLLSGAPVFEPPIFNRLLFGYLGTAVAFGIFSRRLFSGGDDSLLRRVLEALSVLLGALGATLVLRHVFSGPALTEWTSGAAAFAQSVAMILIWLTCAAIVALWRRQRASAVLDWGFFALCVLAGGGAAWTLGFFQNPLFDGSGVGGPIVFNRILWGYAPVAAAFFVVARLVWAGEARLAHALRIGGAATLGLMAFLLIRHGFHGRWLHSAWPVTLAEAGVYGSAAITAAFVATFGRSASDEEPGFYAIVAVAVATIALAIAVGGGAPLSGWPLVNNATMGVFAPTALAAAVALWLRRWNFDLAAQRTYGAAAIGGGLFWLMMQVRLLFPGAGDLLSGWSSSSDPTRFYAYSLAILLFGIVVLVAGLRIKHRDMRLAALGVIALAIFKVFLFDLSDLEGLWRAASFIGLGASLIGIAYLYRWLMPPDRAIPSDSASS